MSTNIAYDRLWLALKQSRPIAFGLFLARMTGNPKAAIVLSQLAHWTRTGRDVAQTNGWIFKTQQQWWMETGLSRAELDTARRRLRTLGFVEETLAGRPATLWYRMNLPNIARALEVCRKEALPVELTFEFMRAPERAVRDLLGPTTAYHRILADLTGGVNAGLLLSRLLQLQRRSIESGYPWFSLTALNWQEDLALNRRSLENAKARLKELGLVQEFHLNRGAKRVYTQVDPALLCELLQEQFASQATAAKRAEVAGIATTRRHQAFQMSTGVGAQLQQNQRSPQANVRIEQAGNSHSGKPDCAKDPLQIDGKVRSSLQDSSTSIRGTNTSSKTDTTTTHARAPEAVLLQNASVVVDVDILLWPDVLPAGSREGATSILGYAPAAVRQTLLDEYGARARRQAVANPLGYLRRLVLLAQQGRFVPELAHLEAQRRRNLAAVSASVREAEAAVTGDVAPALQPSSKEEGRARLAELRAAMAERRARA
ncbi:hypothetical protein OII53_11400 [Achromobacter ruhlandii]|uniref:Replication protein O n=1 Tax=Achromobacter marplatensis TaxID=470868 RepID=A0ABX9GAU0_9BURK|nr:MULTISPECIES: hypothetical protein [Achromobacter]MCV6796786.1 hypothetical protein [Achromobacter ruhlandii]MCV6800992.1 hypothetical protein [Achromobacter ruhlandii]MCV6809849.1 hypothetical protein [Achromobacter ruhlandii]MCV6819137.1 hypothetical protein [Achromobacter ruhlandii]OWT68627.1 hypothetical protein CEY09_12000 [Achromobacter marplatensis]